MITHKDRVLASDLVSLANDLKIAIDTIHLVQGYRDQGLKGAEGRFDYEYVTACNLARYTRAKLDEIFKLLEIDQ